MTTEDKTEIFKALVKFQGIKKEIKRSAKNPHFGNNYAPLGEILSAIREPLLECGLAVMQFPEDEDYLTTKLIHESGQFIESRYQMRPTKNNPQQKGSSLTYQKRYALNAILFLDSDDDDDGQSSSEGEATPEKDWLNEGTPQWEEALKFIDSIDKLNQVARKYKINKANRAKLEELCK